MQLVIRDRICIVSFRQSLLHSNSMASFFYSVEGMQTDAVTMTALKCLASLRAQLCMHREDMTALWVLFRV
jgi:hypothetical protein